MYARQYIETITGITGDSELPTEEEASRAWEEYQALGQNPDLIRGQMLLLPRLDERMTHPTNIAIVQAVTDLVYKEQTVSAFFLSE